MVAVQEAAFLNALQKFEPEAVPEKPRVSVFFPVYNDERTVERVALKSLDVLSRVAREYEVVIVDDATPCRAGEIADRLAAEDPRIRVIHHPENLGYGAAIRTGLANVRYEWICFTDGDDEYDIYDLEKLIRLRHRYDLIITFRYAKLYSTFRIFVSWVYNRSLRALFKSRFRDISTGLRLIRRDLVNELDLKSSSPFIGAEIAIKTMLKGFPVGEVGIQTFPREFGHGSATSWRNIVATIRDMFSCYRTIFSPGYDPPAHRERRSSTATLTRGRNPQSSNRPDQP
ncbi:MAG TPA: glycosyltransferase family 2 protein [Candidatus Aquilonibacter sp.]|nr:glycosyltransferase family 2 protein [Candidatus Aquilonibacter sp.]